MRVGMLWFDNDSKAELKIKLSRATEYYHNKYGKTPTLCYVHPSELSSDKETIQGVEVRTTRSVLPNHFWIGVGD